MHNNKNNFALYIILTMIGVAFCLKVMQYCATTGEVAINGKEFKVEIVKSAQEMAKGLSGRESLKNGKGMLFAFSKADYQLFWMKDMRFSIDIIWINEGKIVDIKEKAPVPLTQYLESYKPVSPAKYVMEINAGLAEKYGFKVGDLVKLDI